MKRNNFLDVLKGICILLVILTHFDWTESERLKYLFPFWMNPAVPIFMIISGYVNAESFNRRQITTLKQAYNIKRIFEKVVFYTKPLLLIFIIEVCLKIFIFRSDLTFVQILSKFLVGGWGPGSYYYPYMIQFVLVFPLIYYIICKWDLKGLVFCVLANVFYELIKVPLGMTDSVYRLIVLRYTLAVALGCYFSVGKYKFKTWQGALSVILGAIFIYAVCYGGYKPMFFYRWSRTSMFAVLYIAPIAYLLIKKTTWECKPLSIIGKASYSLFLVQKVYFHIANRIFDRVEGSFGAMFTAYAICILLGLLFNKIQSYVTFKNITLFKRQDS